MVKITGYDLAMSKTKEVCLVKDKVFNYDGEQKLDKPYKVADAIKQILSTEIQVEERLHVLGITAKGNICGVFEVSHGDLSSSIGNIDGIFRRLLLLPVCSHFILTHNHPSGALTPSMADIDMTTKVRKIGDMLGIKLLDHIIVSSDGYYSFKETHMF